MAQVKRARYPAEYERDVLLKDGSTVHLRPVRADDEELVAGLLGRLSQRSLYLRYHRAMPRIEESEVRRLADVDYKDRFSMVATTGEPERIIAIGYYARLPQGPARPEVSKGAEVAFTVEDTHQGRGIATQLLDALAVAARDHGIETFEASVLGENESMLEVFRATGYPLVSQIKYGTYQVAFPIAETEEAEELAAEREARAAAASIRAILEPRSVAVIGASREAGTIGASVFQNLLRYGYTGVVYPVNPFADAVGGVRAYPSVLDVPDDIELAIIVVPAEHVLKVTDECARKGVRGLVVISAGFRETGGEGAEREKELLAKVRSHGMRLVGPNCMGVLNARPEVSMNATFAPVFARPGNVAVETQSGALGLALLDYAEKLNIGISTFASVGNKADVSGNDLIQYWEQDPNTDVILLYLESFGNPRKFARLARRISPKKPIVAVKSGRSSAGSRAAASHTGALATMDVASDALFKQAGVIRVDTLEQLFDVATLLAHQPVPRGPRVAILTNAGGPGILAADACEAEGLQVLRLGEDTQARLREFLPREAGVSNPVDMIASATPEQYGKALRVLLDDEAVDSVIAIFIPPLVTQAEEVAAAIREAAVECKDRKTLLACFMMARGSPPELNAAAEAWPESGRRVIVPSFAFPEAAALALARASQHGAWRMSPRGSVPKLEVDSGRARAIVDAALSAHPEVSKGRPEALLGPEALEGPEPAEGVWLPPADCTLLLEAYGVAAASIEMARGEQKAIEAADRAGYPVAVKVASPTITHKTDVGGVVLNVNSAEGVVMAYRAIRESLREAGRLSEMEGVAVQRMVPEGVEAIVGVTHDRLFGPLIMFGLGGVNVELLKDVVFRIHPLTDVDAREMVREVKGYPLLEGWRGAPPGDVRALEEVLLRVSRLVEDLPEIAEMDLNPLKVLPPGQGCVVVDARVLLQRLAPHRHAALRR